ncbi:MAG: PmoA family protein [Cellulomonas sp.]
MTGLSALHDVGRAVDVTLGGATLARYVYVPTDVQLESPRPYLHPVRTRGGDLVTAFRPHDHVWHKGIAWSLPVVGEHNFWGGPTYVHGQGYVQLENDGSMDHVALTSLAVYPDRVDVAHTLAWHTQAREHVVDEQRSLAFVVPSSRDDAWVLTFATTMTNVSSTDLTIGSPTTRGRENAGYGGLFWRGPRSFTGGTLLAPDFAGGEEIRGSRGPWMGFVGRHDETGGASTVVIVDGTENPSHPPQWFARTELFGCLNPAPFFSTEVPFAPGDSLTFRYAVVVADGASNPATAAELAALGVDTLPA